MERALNQDERIRRAQEIYARRQNIRERTRRATVNVYEPKKFKTFKNVILQALICLLLYLIFYLINTTNYSFSEEVLNKTEEIISSEVDFVSIYNNLTGKINEFMSNIENNVGQKEENTIIEENVEGNNEIEEISYIEDINDNKNEIGVVEIKEKLSDSIAINNEEDTSQEQIIKTELSETERIKQKYSFVLPVKRKSVIRIWRKRTFITNRI